MRHTRRKVRVKGKGKEPSPYVYIFYPLPLLLTVSIFHSRLPLGRNSKPSRHKGLNIYYYELCLFITNFVYLLPTLSSAPLWAQKRLRSAHRPGKWRKTRPRLPRYQSLPPTHFYRFQRNRERLCRAPAIYKREWFGHDWGDCRAVEKYLVWNGKGEGSNPDDGVSLYTIFPEQHTNFTR